MAPRFPSLDHEPPGCPESLRPSTGVIGIHIRGPGERERSCPPARPGRGREHPPSVPGSPTVNITLLHVPAPLLVRLMSSSTGSSTGRRAGETPTWIIGSSCLGEALSGDDVAYMGGSARLPGPGDRVRRRKRSQESVPGPRGTRAFRSDDRLHRSGCACLPAHCTPRIPRPSRLPTGELLLGPRPHLLVLLQGYPPVDQRLVQLAQTLQEAAARRVGTYP